MKCKHCGKEVEFITQFFDDTPGAVIVALDSDCNLCVWPAAWGLEKKQGCVEFCTAKFNNNSLEEEVDSCNVTRLSDSECKALYGDAPAGEEAWLVKPIEDGYEWTHIDEDIVFSE
jgi:hypothetical protein